MKDMVELSQISWAAPSDALPDDDDEVLLVVKRGWSVRVALFMGGAFHLYGFDDNLETWYLPAEIYAWANLPGEGND